MDFERIIAVRNSKTIYRDHGRVIKVFDDEYSKSDILNEALNDARAQESGINAPKLLEVASFDGKWAIVTEYVEGETLQSMMDAHPEKMDEYLDLFTDLQLEVQNREIPLLNKNKDKLMRKIKESGFDPTLRYELLTRLNSTPIHTHVLHGDFCPSNIIIPKEGGKPFIIDWAHLSQGNASYDIANTYITFQLTGNLNLADKYLDIMVEKSKIAKTYIQKWIPIVAASKLSTCRKEEEEYLKHIVNVVDYE